MKPELIKFVAGTKAKASEINENFDKLLNHVIETEENDVRVYKPDQEFEYGKYVLGEVDGVFGIYKSVAEENKGNPLTDENYWVKVDLLKEFDLGYYLNKSQITNCITEIPQKIKLVLNNGVLTLKAGSEVIIPNGKNADGSLKFDYMTIESDKAIPCGSTTAEKRFVWFTLPNGYGNGAAQYCFSGNTSVMNSTTPNTYSTFYNTETNKMYRGNGTTWEERQYSLPVCLATNDATGAFTSIDRVFNGMGYIGSTLWVDKGVKGLIPNGKNKDGSLNNLEFTIDSLLINTQTNTGGKTWGLYFNNDGSHAGFSLGVYKTSIKTLSDRPTNWVGGYCIYVEDENRIYVNQNTAPSIVIMVADIVIGSTSITSLTPKTTFRAVDYNEFAKVQNSAIGYPDYTKGITKSWNTEYTADKSGWVYASGYTGETFWSIEVDSQVFTLGTNYSATSRTGIMLPIKEGSKYKGSGGNIYEPILIFYPLS